MQRSRPTETNLRELLAGGRRDLETIFESWPTIGELSDSINTGRRPAHETTDADLIRAQGGAPSDPTLIQALNITAATTWRRDVVKLIGVLQTLAARAVDMIGELPEDCCPVCRHYLDDGRPVHAAGGRKVHRACYDRRRLTIGEQR